MSLPRDPVIGCPGCHAADDTPLNLLDGRLVGPITTVRVRSMAGEHNQRVLLITCQNCGLISTYDAEWVQAQMESTAE